jgi:hypothetical protein
MASLCLCGYRLPSSDSSLLSARRLLVFATGESRMKDECSDNLPCRRLCLGLRLWWEPGVLYSVITDLKFDDYILRSTRNGMLLNEFQDWNIFFHPVS